MKNTKNYYAKEPRKIRKNGYNGKTQAKMGRNRNKLEEAGRTRKAEKKEKKSNKNQKKKHEVTKRE